MRLLSEAWLDIRFAARTYRRAPGFAAAAFVTLVVGIAAVTSIFSYINAVYFAALPYKDANRIVALSEIRPREFGTFSDVSRDVVQLVRRGARSFERVSAYSTGGGTVLFGTEPSSLRTLLVDSAFVPLLDLQPQIGRVIMPEDIAANAAVMMISDALWRVQYGGDPNVLGKSITLGARSYSIVGVMPPGFEFPYKTDAITPLPEVTDSAGRAHDRPFSLIGKLRPGVSRDAARSEMAVVGARLSAIDPIVYKGARLVVRDEMLDRRARQFMPLPSVFLGAGLFVLLIACANVANLFLVRVVERRTEMAIRASLGAGRARLVRQALAETLLLGAAAAVCGTALSALLVRLGLTFVPTEGFPSWFHVGVDANVLAFAIGITMLVTIAVGLAPAREGARINLVAALKRGGGVGGAKSGVARASRRGLVLQLALAVSLFVSAALLLRSYQRLATIDLGYPAERIASIKPWFDATRYPDADSRQRFVDRMVRDAASLPGVSSVAARGSFAELRAKQTVQSGDFSSANRYDGRLIPDRDTTRALRVFSDRLVVGDHYFRLLNLRIRQGRGFSPNDGEQSTPSAIISAQLARLLWAGATPIGRTIQVGVRGDALTVIGVVDDVRSLRGGSRGFRDEPMPTVYLTTRQATSFNPEIVLTGPGDVLALRTRVVDLARANDRTLMFFRGATLADQFGEAMLVTRVFGGLIGVFAVSALGLAIIGIYGVIAFGVQRRTREIGIRIALGGTTRDVIDLIVVDGLRFVGVGLALGLALALALSRVVKIFLYGVSPLDPVAYAAVTIVFGAVAIAACYFPARRVTRVDPLLALRAD